MRQIVESAAVGNLRNAASVLSRIAKHVAGRVQARVEQPTAEGLLQFLESQMQGSRGNAELRSDKIRRQRGVMSLFGAFEATLMSDRRRTAAAKAGLKFAV